MPGKNDFNRWQQEATSQDDAALPAKPIDLRWRASGRSLRRERYNDAQLQAMRDAVIFRWGVAILAILAVVGMIVYLAGSKDTSVTVPLP